LVALRVVGMGTVGAVTGAGGSKNRRVTDEAIEAMAKTGGAMGINFISSMVKAQEPTTVDDVIDHFDRVVASSMSVLAATRGLKTPGRRQLLSTAQ
jgi:hypothetical protein